MVGVQRGVVVMAVLTLVSGVVQSLSLKWQDRQELAACADPSAYECRPRHFQQAFLQTFILFVGEFFCIVLWGAHKAYRRHKRIYGQYERHADEPTPSSVCGMDFTELSRLFKPRTFNYLTDDVATPAEIEEEDDEEPEIQIGDPSRRCPWWWWTTPAPLDLVESALANIATIITYASTVQMLNNFTVIVSATLSVVMLQRPLRVHEWLGCSIVTLALALGSVQCVLNPEEATNIHESRHWLGIILAIMGTCVHSIQQIWEERLFQKGRMHSLLAVSIEGGAGIILTGAILPIVHLSNFENIKQGFYQLSISASLKSALVVYAVCSFAHNSSGVLITKWSNALLRGLFMALRPPLVWIVEMMIGWNSFSWWSLIGMLLLACGLMIHLRLPPMNPRKFRPILLYPVPCCGLTIPDDEEEFCDKEKSPSAVLKEIQLTEE